MAVQIVSGATADLATVDPTSKAVRATLYDTVGNPLIVTSGGGFASNAQASGILMAGIADNTYRTHRTDMLGNARVGFDTLLLHDDVEGTTINTALWTASVSTMTQAQTSTSGIRFNNGASVAVSVYSILTSQKQFSKMQGMPLRGIFKVKAVPQNNSVIEVGFGAPANNTAQIATGCFWRATASGTMVPVIAYNSSDAVQGTDVSSAFGGAGGTSSYFIMSITVEDSRARFTLENASTGQMISEQVLQIPSSQPKVWSATHLPCFSRLYNTGTAPATAPDFFLGDAAVYAYDQVTNKPYTHQVATANTGGSENNPSTFAQTSNWTNSTAPVSATLSNTAAGYTTLGGLFGFAAVAGAITDYALFGFTVPSPYTFVCTGIHITTYNTGIAVAGTPTLLHWAVASNSSAVSLATAGLWRTPVGSQSFPVAAAAGANVPDIDISFECPLKTDGGRIFHIILRMPIATATATQVIQGSVDVRGYFE